MLTRQQFLIGLAAGTGGVAPNVVNLAQGFIGQNPNIPGWLYYVGVAIFFCLGAIVALIFAETDYRKAFFLGISLPAFIAAAQSQTPPRIVADLPRPQAAIFDLMPSAIAEPSAVRLTCSPLAVPA